MIMIIFQLYGRKLKCLARVITTSLQANSGTYYLHNQLQEDQMSLVKNVVKHYQLFVLFIVEV